MISGNNARKTYYYTCSDGLPKQYKVIPSDSYLFVENNIRHLIPIHHSPKPPE